MLRGDAPGRLPGETGLRRGGVTAAGLLLGADQGQVGHLISVEQGVGQRVEFLRGVDADIPVLCVEIVLKVRGLEGAAVAGVDLVAGQPQPGGGQAGQVLRREQRRVGVGQKVVVIPALLQGGGQQFQLGPGGREGAEIPVDVHGALQGGGAPGLIFLPGYAPAVYLEGGQHVPGGQVAPPVGLGEELGGHRLASGHLHQGDGLLGPLLLGVGDGQTGGVGAGVYLEGVADVGLAVAPAHLLFVEEHRGSRPAGVQPHRVVHQQHQLPGAVSVKVQQLAVFYSGDRPGVLLLDIAAVLAAQSIQLGQIGPPPVPSSVALRGGGG